jgi:hypothetical protein
VISGANLLEELSMTNPLTRRSLLRLGALGMLSLPNLLRAEEKAPNRKAKVRSVIFLHQFGGPSHIDSFDPKPAAPDGIRGEFKTVATSCPGIQMTDQLPRLAKHADKLCLVRSVNHTMKNHNGAAYYSLTGHAPPLDDIRLRDTLELFPAYGAVVDRLAPAKSGMPTFVAYPHVLRDGSVTPGQTASFLGKAYSPLLILQDPNSAEFRLPELSLPEGLSLQRLENRREVQRLIDQQTELMEISPTAQGIDKFVEKAMGMLTTPKVKEAFDLSKEKPATRDKYGRTTYGQGCLLARRLVEAGARFINVYFANNIGGRTNSGGWDTHAFDSVPAYPILKNYLLPTTDQSISALIEDLAERGLLDETLIVWMGEFGRTPRIKEFGGRDHWPQCYTAMLIGGVKRGFVYGSSDRTGSYPASDPVKPDDLAATMYYLLGIDPHTEVFDALNRPLPIAAGNPITGILS